MSDYSKLTVAVAKGAKRDADKAKDYLTPRETTELALDLFNQLQTARNLLGECVEALGDQWLDGCPPVSVILLIERARTEALRAVVSRNPELAE
jgi:hypothetical protein